MLSALFFFVACGTKNDTAVTSTAPASPPALQPKNDPMPTQGLWVTFSVRDEQFKAVVTQSKSMAYVLNYLSGHETKKVPNGKLLKVGEFNPGWSWHLDPDSIVFTDLSIELCDGRPTYIEEHEDDWLLSVKNYCPWSAVIESMRDCRSGTCEPSVSSIESSSSST